MGSNWNLSAVNLKEFVLMVGKKDQKILFKQTNLSMEMS